MTDASLQKIAATYGTPTFVFDTDALQARVRAIQTIWGREIDLCYSIKANPFLLPAMMQVTARLEVCSPGELSLCESLHTADARVIYSGVNKTPVDIARAVADATRQLEGYEFGDSAREVQSFFWNEVCDWYIELCKGRLLDGEGEERLQVQRNLCCRSAICRMLHVRPPNGCLCCCG